jgi:hypothetical protein
MNKADYDRYTQLVNEFEKCLIDCAQEISMISNGRELIGEFDGEIDLCDDGRYYVRFETWCAEYERLKKKFGGY